MCGVMNLNTQKVNTKVSLSNTFQIFIVTIVMDMDIMQQITRNLSLIAIIIKIGECLEIITMQVAEGDFIAMKVEKEGKSYVIDATTLDILQGIVKHLMISAMEEI